MRALPKNKKAKFLLLFFLAFLPGLVLSKVGVTVKNAETELTEGHYQLSADVDFQLGEKSIEALNNGVPLYWTYLFRVNESRQWFLDKTVEEKSFRYRIQYHALLNMYRVKNESNGAVDSFSTLAAALDLISTLRGYPVLDKTDTVDPANYVIAIKVKFEQDALPLPLRPMAYLNPEWYLSSAWYLCPLKK